uniref:Nodule Cysteine-Rich (NCR) secreted peptide n=1 Tax=Parastrongyloides trichosuri TaxID=131310 RepID=A0A0N4Z395_PARTI
MMDILRLFLLIFIFFTHYLVFSNVKNNIKADCPSSKMCPPGWSVQRDKLSKDKAAVTCEIGVKKCEKPYSCVSSYCGIKFCCANDSKLSIFFCL